MFLRGLSRSTAATSSPAGQHSFAQNCLLICRAGIVHKLKANIMKSARVVCIAILVLHAGVEAQQEYSGGIESGKEQGMPCVLYPKGESWADARTVMYAEVEDQFEDVNAFVATAIEKMAKTHGKPKEKIASGKTKDGHDYFINEYPATKNYSQWERVAYVQLPHAVAYIVLSSRDKASYEKDSGALETMLKDSFLYLKPKKE